MSDFDKWKAKKHAVYSAYGETYFLGAERAWNYQQKKIDDVLKFIDDKCNKFCESHDMDKVALLEEIEELLK